MIRSKIHAALHSLGLDKEEVFLETSLKMILLMLLIFVHDIYMAHIAVPIMVLPGLIIKRIAINRYYWLALASIFTVLYLVNGLNGYLPNHKYLYVYLMISVVFVLFSRKMNQDWKALYHKSARWIIGICFLLATIGKFVSPDFVNGDFFEFTSLTDERFHGMTSILTGIDTDVLFAGYKRFMGMLQSSDPNAVATLSAAPHLSALSLFLAYWTIFLEGMIAICYLVPNSNLLYKHREFFLLAFIFTTYPIATVSGFVTILSILAFIQSFKSGRPNRYTLIYLVLFLSQPLFMLPFYRIFERLF